MSFLLLLISVSVDLTNEFEYECCGCELVQANHSHISINNHTGQDCGNFVQFTLAEACDLKIWVRQRYNNASVGFDNISTGEGFVLDDVEWFSRTVAANPGIIRIGMNRDMDIQIQVLNRPLILLRGDLDLDGDVDYDDFVIASQAVGPCRADLTLDGSIGWDDLLEVLEYWGIPCD